MSARGDREHLLQRGDDSHNLNNRSKRRTAASVNICRREKAKSGHEMRKYNYFDDGNKKRAVGAPAREDNKKRFFLFSPYPARNVGGAVKLWVSIKFTSSRNESSSQSHQTLSWFGESTLIRRKWILRLEIVNWGKSLNNSNEMPSYGEQRIKVH